MRYEPQRGATRWLRRLFARSQSANSPAPIPSPARGQQGVADFVLVDGGGYLSQASRARLGKAVVETLARDLQVEFPGRNGFSSQNLWLMRQFFNEYSDKPKLQPLVAEISWAKNLLIMARCGRFGGG